MSAYAINGHTFEHDEEGYLKNLADWNKELAELIAKDEKIDMTPEHWEVVNFLGITMRSIRWRRPFASW
jgi:tRNA 2-thiouridine synthesizing protein E